MHSTLMKTPAMVLAVLCTALVLTLATAMPLLADSRVQTAQTAHEGSDACAEPYRPIFVVQSLGTDLQVPKPLVASGRQPEETDHAELQVPAALWRTLLMEEGISRSIDLHVPAALLATLSAEGGVQRPQRSQDPCIRFFSLY